MQRFNYVAKDASGNEQRGVVEAKDMAEAQLVLRQNDLVAKSLVPESSGGKKKGGLNVAGRPLSQREMGERLLVDKSDLTGLVDRMERAGLVERRAVAGDRRRHAVSLTAAGRAELARSEPDYAALVNRAMSSFTRSEVAALTRLMVKLHDSLDALENL